MPTAKYPGSIASDADLKVADNRVFTTLRGAISAADTVITVADPARIEVNMLMTIDAEVLSVSAISANNLTVARGFDGTTAAAHSSGRTVAAFWTGWHHNAMAAEVKAIEAALGPALSNVSTNAGGVSATAFDFAAQQPGGALTANIINSVTLTPVPSGVNATGVNHRLYISGGVGAAEAVLITGGTAVSGAASGTVTFTPLNNHSGAWTIQSATDGIQEAVASLGASGGTVLVPVGAYTLNADVSFANKSNVRILVMPGATFSGSGVLPVSPNASLKSIVSRIALNYTGSVMMIHAPATSNQWMTYKPDGSILDVTGTTTQGLQESINYAQDNGYPLLVMGGGIVFPGSSAVSRLTCSTPISFPTGWGNTYHFIGVDLHYTGNVASDFITFDSADLTEVDFHHSEIIYPGNGAAVRFNPAANNGEDFAGFTSSTFRLGTIAIVNPVTLSPESTHGIGVRISMPDLGLGLANGDGLFTNVSLYVAEINSGLTGIQVDNPGAGNTFSKNTITAPAIHGQGTTGVAVGTSAGAANLIFGNHWSLNIAGAPASTALSAWGGLSSGGGGDLYEAALSGSATGLLLNSSAANNMFLIAHNGCATPVTNNAASATNRLLVTGVPTRATPVVGASPYTFTNTAGRPMSVFVSGGTVSQIGIGVDGTNFDNAASPPTNTYYFLTPGMSIRITYSVAPFVFQYF